MIISNIIHNYKIQLFSIFILGIVLRISITPFNIPLSLDALDYFAYGTYFAQNWKIPDGILLSNFGWPLLVSIFFVDQSNSQMIDLMNIQRFLGIICSSITIIPIYFLCREFFDKRIAVLSSSVIIFEPRLIENSMLGITDSLFLLLVSITILFAFYKSNRFLIIGFISAAFATSVRYEGFLLIIPLIVTFFLTKNFSQKNNFKFIVGILLWLLIIFIYNFIFFENLENNFFDVFGGGSQYVSKYVIMGGSDDDDEYFSDRQLENKILIFIQNSISRYILFTGWLMIPIIGIFALPGLFFLNKKIERKKIIFIIFGVVLSLAGLYAFGRGINETRYIFPLIPIFIIISCYFLQFISYKINKRVLFVVSVIGMLLISTGFMINEKIDSTYESEIYDATKYLVTYANGVNNYDGNKFVRTAGLENSWPDLLDLNERKKMDTGISKIQISSEQTIEQILSEGKNKNLTHLVITERENNIYLKKLINQNAPNFLEEVYDSRDYNANNIIIIYEIKYDRINNDIES